MDRNTKHGADAIDTNETETPSLAASVGRREFLLMAAGAGLFLALPAASLAGNEKWVPIGKAAQFVLNQPRAVVLPGNAGTLFVTRTAASKLTAVSAVCTHKGCIVGWNPAKKDLVCPCHGAEFALDGKNLKGTRKHPAEKLPNLAAVPVKEARGQVMVDVSALTPAAKPSGA